MRIVLLCKRHNHRKVIEILLAFHEHNVPVCGIVALERHKPWPPFKQIVHKAIQRCQTRMHKPAKQASSFAAMPFYHVSNNGRTVTGAQQKGNGRASWQATQDFPAHVSRPAEKSIDAFARVHHVPLVAVSDLNGAACVAALQKLQPDLLILGGTPIIRENILAVPSTGTLNVHMAWLPGMRGMNVAEWSVFCDAPIAVTVHFVDAGVDTGAVLYRERIDISECRSIAAVRQKLSTQQHFVLARATKLFADGQLRPEMQTKTLGKQYYVLHESLKQIVERKLLRGHVKAE